MMTTRDRSVTARTLVLGLVGLNAFLLLAGLVFGTLVRPPTSVEGYLTAFPWFLTSIVYSGLAVLIIFRQPRHTIGWLFVVIGILNGVTFSMVATGEYLESTIELPWLSEQAQILFEVMSELIWILALFLPLTLMLQFFPDGRLPSRRWWPITLAAIIGFVSTAIGFVVEQSGHADSFQWLSDLSGICMVVGITGALAAVLVRFIRAQDTERLQIKWLAYTAVVGIILMFLFALLFGGDHPIVGIHTTLLPSLIAISVGIAILRYRLYDIDIIIRRTLQYGIVTGLLAVVYLGLVVIFQSLFVTLEGSESSIFIVISTLVVAGLFNPLRVRVQKAIDRRFYRKKYQAEQVLSQFATVARDEVDLDKLTGELLDVIQETMQPESVSFLLVSDDR